MVKKLKGLQRYKRYNVVRAQYLKGKVIRD